jgi:hypothetical protein
MPHNATGGKQFFATLSRDNRETRYAIYCIKNYFFSFSPVKSFSACSLLRVLEFRGKSFLHFPSLKNVNNLIFIIGFGLLGKMALR